MLCSFLKTLYLPEFHVIPSGTEDGVATGNVVKCGLQQYSESWKHAGRIGNKYIAAVESLFLFDQASLQFICKRKQQQHYFIYYTNQNSIIQIY